MEGDNWAAMKLITVKIVDQSSNFVSYKRLNTLKELYKTKYASVKYLVSYLDASSPYNKWVRVLFLRGQP